MGIDDIKLKRFAAKFGNRPPKQRRTEPVAESAPEESVETVEEGEKSDETPTFVKHCVAAIASKDEVLGDLKRKKVSPFAICNATYNKNKRTLAAIHSRGRHHTAADYKRSLEKLREETEIARLSRPDRAQITFDANTTAPRHADRRKISYNPE